MAMACEPHGSSVRFRKGGTAKAAPTPAMEEFVKKVIQSIRPGEGFVAGLAELALEAEAILARIDGGQDDG